MAREIINCVLVAKPGIVAANLVTAAGGFFLASRGSVDMTLLMSAIIGISFVVASGCVFNNYIDRDLDRKMRRTQGRALARGLVSGRGAIACASVIGIAGAVLLFAETNILCLSIVLSGFAIYVCIYSLFLKRSSLHSILVGSLAGAAPPLAGYCAVSNRFDTGALILLAIFVLWQAPHSYAIALYRSDDYAAAHIPMQPLSRGRPAAKKDIAGYILAFMAAALTLTLCGYTGYYCLAVVTAFGLSWLCLALSGAQAHHDRLWAKRLFVFSVLTILVVSIMISIDSTVPAASRMLLSWNP